MWTSMKNQHGRRFTISTALLLLGQGRGVSVPGAPGVTVCPNVGKDDTREDTKGYGNERRRTGGRRRRTRVGACDQVVSRGGRRRTRDALLTWRRRPVP